MLPTEFFYGTYRVTLIHLVTHLCFDSPQVPVAVFLTKPTAIYHSLGASESLPIVSTSEGRGGIKTVPALMGEISITLVSRCISRLTRHEHTYLFHR